MKLYYHPASTTSRPIVLFASEARIPLDLELVDLFTGAHYQPSYESINPSRQVPVLDDDGFVLTESSAILKYLAEKTRSSAYPSDLRKRARVNERMDWFNTGFYRDFSYGLVYPQIFPFMRREDPKVQSAVIEWGKERAAQWLKVLDQNILGPQNDYLCGNEITIADYFGIELVLPGDVIGCTFAQHPNITRWREKMRALPSWNKVHEVFDSALVAPNKGKEFVRV